ncbi:MAG: GTP-binding protein [Candidatus Lokiarchaeota archaeon]|nr:GTP-binding protein [Candidatus Lokiarchaeota archaeon]
MIHNTYLVKNPSGEIIAHSSYWPVEVREEQVDEFIETREEIREQSGNELTPELPLSIGNDKFMATEIESDLLLIFATDESEDESNIRDRLNEAKKVLSDNLEKGIDYIVENYQDLIEDAVTTRLKIALVGEGGVGKTTTLHLLLGDSPPLQYVPTIALNLETVENIRFGNYSLVLWDFAGQERFRKLWKFYFHGADVIFLVCDSTLRNVIISKDILKMIRRDAPKVPVFAIANKQDKPKAMKPEVVQKILGVPTYPMVAIDKDRREEMLRLLMNAAAQYVGVSVPDLPPSEVLTFVDAEPSEVIKEQEEEKTKAEEEEVEVVETVLVDEEGRIIDEAEGDYEVIEEVVEVVEDEEPAEEPVPEVSAESEAISGIEVSEMGDETVDDQEAVSVQDGHSRTEEPIAFSLETTQEVVDSEDSETGHVDISWKSTSEIVEAEETGETSIVEKAEWDTRAVDYHQKTKKEAIENGREMAKEIISEALDADDLVASDLEKASGEELDAALEAFSSDETLPTEEEEEKTTAELEENTKEELEEILGDIECVVRSPKCEKESDSSSEPDKEAIREMEQILGEMDSKKKLQHDINSVRKRSDSGDDHRSVEES